MQPAGHPDLLDERERLSRPLLVSLAVHGGLVAALVLGGIFKHAPILIGDQTPGSGVAVSAVKMVPLIRKQGPVNPVANDSESTVPQEPVKPLKEQRPPTPKAPEKAVELPKKTPEKIIPPKPATLYRPKQDYAKNQVFSRQAPAMVSPQLGTRGGAGVGIGPNSTFGYQFGAYAQQIRDLIASKWNQAGVTSRPGAQAVVTFQILRDGTVRATNLAQTSGSYTLDLSARRAILDANPLPPLPPGFPRGEADVELMFELGR